MNVLILIIDNVNCNNSIKLYDIHNNYMNQNHENSLKSKHCLVCSKWIVTMDISRDGVNKSVPKWINYQNLSKNDFYFCPFPKTDSILCSAQQKSKYGMYESQKCIWFLWKCNSMLTLEKQQKMENPFNFSKKKILQNQNNEIMFFIEFRQTYKYPFMFSIWWSK